jgi:hypothetical protein
MDMERLTYPGQAPASDIIKVITGLRIAAAARLPGLDKMPGDQALLTMSA